MCIVSGFNSYTIWYYSRLLSTPLGKSYSRQDNMSTLSFCFLGIYKIVKLYLNKIKDYLIYYLVSFLAIIKYLRFL